jgi:ribulose-phosphate 3-epimerase
MAEIIPAILTSDSDELKKQLDLASSFSDRVQIDIIDGCFVNNQTIKPAQIRNKQDLLIDLHLMVCDPEKFIEDCYKISPNLIIFQYEIDKNIESIIDKINKDSKPCGIAINPSTSVEEVSHLLFKIKHLLIMSYPAGFSGQNFDEKNLVKVKQARAINQKLEIGLDGGVSIDNVGLIAKSGFDIINVNSAIFGTQDPIKSYNILRGKL